MKQSLIIALVLFLASCVSHEAQLREKRMELLEKERRLLELKQRRLETCLDDAGSRFKRDFMRCENLFEKKMLNPAELLQCQHNAEVIYRMDSDRCNQWNQ
jgi:hypothetical protein